MSSRKTKKADSSNDALRSDSNKNANAKTKNETEIPIWKSVLSLEPALVAHMIGAIMVIMTVQDFLLEKACRVNLAYSDEICDALSSKKTSGLETQEKNVQKLISSVLVYRTMIENAFPIFLVFLIGAWSDKYGRKLPLLAVVFAFIIQNFALIACVYLKDVTGAWTVAIVSSLIASLSGNQACMFVAIFSYVSDNTSVENRTMRQGITHSCIFLGLTLGMASGGILAKSGLPFEKIFLIGVGLETFAFFYFLFSMKNQPQPGAMKGKTGMQIFMELFDFNHVKESLNSVFKKREGNKRMKLLLLLFIHSCVLMPMMGEMGVTYLFTRLQFNWDGGDYGQFMTFKMVMGFLSNFVSMGLLSGKLGLSDPANAIVASISNLISSLVFAFATSPSMMYVGPLVALFSGAAMITPRGLISQIIPTGELGKVNSFIGSLESIIPLVGSWFYTQVYTIFLDTLPGSFFLISGALFIPPIFIYLWFMQDATVMGAKKKKN